MSNQEVTNFIHGLEGKAGQEWQGEVAISLRKTIREVIPDVEERIQYGKPHFLKNGHYAAVISPAKDKISFMIFNASGITEIPGFLRSMGKGERKTATITRDQTVDYPALAELLRQASTSL